MKWVCVLFVVTTACAMVQADTSAASASTHTKSKAASSKSTGTRTGTTTATAKRASTTRRTKSGRRSRPAAPSYQLHPDPDRYKQIQQALADRGYFKGEVNGQWGDDSVDALKRFQADQKLTDDGKINAPTLTGLGLGPKHDSASSASPPPATVPQSQSSEPKAATVPPAGIPTISGVAPAGGPPPKQEP